MQTYAQPTLTSEQGRAIWLSMRDEVQAQRLMTPTLTSTLGRLLVLFILLGVALTLSWFQTSWLGMGLAYLALSVLLAQFAFMGHDAGHGAISQKSSVNRLLGQLSMTLVTGLAFDEWIDRHRAHHRFCQVEEQDPDMAVAHVISLTSASLQQKTGFAKFMSRYQHVYIWPLSFFFGHSQRHLSQWGVLSDLRRYPLDALVLILHGLLWFGLPCLVFNVSFGTALLSYVIPLIILGPHLAAIFWVNHIGMPLIEKTDDFSFFEHQYVTSRSISSSAFWNWFFGGLNFQIEHHLFPQVPSHRLGAVQCIVRKQFEARRIPYSEVTWPQAIRSIAVHLRAVKLSTAS
jgi:fatty acid desaturase